MPAVVSLMRKGVACVSPATSYGDLASRGLDHDRSSRCRRCRQVQSGQDRRDLVSLKRTGWLPLKTIETTYSGGFDGFEGRGTDLSVNSAVDGMLHQ